jgi:hypothetical protein
MLFVWVFKFYMMFCIGMETSCVTEDSTWSQRVRECGAEEVV